MKTISASVSTAFATTFGTAFGTAFAMLIIILFTFQAFHAHAYPIMDGIFNADEYQSVFFEDTDINTSYLDPGYGGQPYDVEYLGLTLQNGILNFGLQAGLGLKFNDAADGHNFTARPGSLALDINDDGIFDYGIRFFTEEIELVTAPTADSWIDVCYFPEADPWRIGTKADPGAPEFLTSGSAYDQFGDIVFADTYDAFGNTSYSLEGVINLNMIGYHGGDVSAHFTMFCGNDVANITTTGTAPVPEPATMFLMGTGLMGIAGIYRKKFKK